MDIRKIALLNNTEYTITRPIVKTVIKDLKTIVFRNDTIMEYYLNNNTDSDFESNKNVIDNNLQQDYLEISYERDTVSEKAYNNTVMRLNNYAVLMDKDIGFSVSPNTQYTKYIINLKYYSRNKNVIIKLINYLKSVSSRESNFYPHNVDYYYTIPNTVLALLKNINDLKNPNTSIYDYIENISQVPIDYLNSKTTKYSIPIIREQQVSVISNLETDPYELKPEKDDKYGYNVELQYRIDVEEPVSLLLNYPILVNNKSISTDFLPIVKRPELVYNSSYYTQALSEMVSDMKTYLGNGRPITRVPVYDMWKPVDYTKQGFVRLVSFLLQIDNTDSTILFNLNDLASITINSNIIDYLKTKTGNNLFTLGKDIFLFELYSNNNLTSYDLYLDTDMNIKSTTPLDLTKEYHLVLNAMWDLNMLYLSGDIGNDIINDYITLLKSININPMYSNDWNRFTVEILRIIAYDFDVLDEITNTN